jgi:hypothetical protein
MILNESPLVHAEGFGILEALGFLPSEEVNDSNFYHDTVSAEGYSKQLQYIGKPSDITKTLTTKEAQHLIALLESDPKFKKLDFPNNYARLSIVLNPGGKIRYIAIGNWVLQGVLKPLHDILMRYARRIKGNDCTYHQRLVFSFYKKELLSNKLEFHSVDLTAATDRLPLLVQEAVLSCIIKDAELANLWFNLISDIKFYIPKHLNNYDGSNTIRYSVGQGIGLYTS